MSLQQEFEYDRNNVVKDLKEMKPSRVSDLVLTSDYSSDIIINYESFCILLKKIDDMQKEIDSLKAWKKRCTVQEYDDTSY